MTSKEIVDILTTINDPIIIDSLFATIKYKNIKYNGKVRNMIRKHFIYYCIKYELEVKYLRKITILNLSGSIGLHHELPSPIDVMVNLEKLVIQNTKMVTLPESIGNLKRLKSLCLNNNRLVTLPESIGNLKRLNFLYLNNNQLTELPNTIGKLKIYELYLNNNQLTELPNTISNLTNFKCITFEQQSAHRFTIN